MSVDATTNKVEAGVAVGNRLAFTQSCAYPDGTKVYCSAMVDLKGGKNLAPGGRTGLGRLMVPTSGGTIE